MRISYAISEIRKHGTNRHWWRQRFLSRVISRYYTNLNAHDSTRLVDLDWDNVLLLDACRYDLFEEALQNYELPGELRRRQSVQSATPGYLKANFAGGVYHDVVYVTANPYVNTELATDTFHAIENVWEDGWDGESGTVLPNAVQERALSAAEEYPDKRLIVHFNQPHAPFVGKVSLGERNVSAIREKALGNEEPDPKKRAKTPFAMLEAGEVTRDEVWEAYLSNLELVLPSVDTLLDTLTGKTVVTSDHGNALGEFATPFPIRVYGHPLGILIPPLTDVPWHIHQNGNRKTVKSEPPTHETDSDRATNEITKERLRALGYRE